MDCNGKYFYRNELCYYRKNGILYVSGGNYPSHETNHKSMLYLGYTFEPDMVSLSARIKELKDYA